MAFRKHWERWGGSCTMVRESSSSSSVGDQKERYIQCLPPHFNRNIVMGLQAFYFFPFHFFFFIYFFLPFLLFHFILFFFTIYGWDECVYVRFIYCCIHINIYSHHDRSCTHDDDALLGRFHVWCTWLTQYSSCWELL